MQHRPGNGGPAKTPPLGLSALTPEAIDALQAKEALHLVAEELRWLRENRQQDEAVVRELRDISQNASTSAATCVRLVREQSDSMGAAVDRVLKREDRLVHEVQQTVAGLRQTVEAQGERFEKILLEDISPKLTEAKLEAGRAMAIAEAAKATAEEAKRGAEEVEDEVDEISGQFQQAIIRRSSSDEAGLEELRRLGLEAARTGVGVITQRQTTTVTVEAAAKTADVEVSKVRRLTAWQVIGTIAVGLAGSGGLLALLMKGCG